VSSRGASFRVLSLVGSRKFEIQEIFFLWRPFLRDPRDDMVLELAVAAGCEAVVRHNRKDFRGIEQFGLKALTPQELLKRIGELR